MSKRLTLVVVNGHPDDETVTAGGVMARYTAQGLRVVCVTATHGEVGEIVDPEIDTPENRARLGEVRDQEQERALARLGPIERHNLGFRDSGMMGSPENDDPRSFWQTPAADAAAPLVQIIRAAQADVVVCPNAYGGDGHPDHIRAADIARIAFDRAGDSGAYPEQLSPDGLQPWSPAKLYEAVNQFGRREKLARALASGNWLSVAHMLARVGRHWTPGRERHRARMAAAQRPVTTRVDIGAFLEAKYAAMAEYRTQIAPTADLFALTSAERRRVSPTEDFTLVKSRIDVVLPEDDLFAGIR